MVGTLRTKVLGPADPAGAVKQQVARHCVETAIAAVHRVCDFRVKEIDCLVENYINVIPVDLRNRPLSDFA